MLPHLTWAWWISFLLLKWRRLKMVMTECKPLLVLLAFKTTKESLPSELTQIWQSLLSRIDRLDTHGKSLRIHVGQELLSRRTTILPIQPIMETSSGARPMGQVARELGFSPLQVRHPTTLEVCHAKSISSIKDLGSKKRLPLKTKEKLSWPFNEYILMFYEMGFWGFGVLGLLNSLLT